MCVFKVIYYQCFLQSQKFSESYSVMMFYALKFLLVMVGILSGNLARLNILSAFSVSEIASKII